MPVKLECQVQGSGVTHLVILHGLLGSGQNWKTIAGRLAETDRTVYLPDARNHGGSPHDGRHDYEALAEDLIELLDERSITAAHLIGHSVGAMAVMLAACRYPDRVLSVVSVDFAPRAYVSANRQVLEAMSAVDLAVCRSRQDVAGQLAPTIRDKSLLMFVMTNLRQDEHRAWHWRVNLPVLLDFTDYMKTFVMPSTSLYGGPALFLRGDRSDYVRPEDESLILRHFPKAQIETIQDAGHWIHADQPDAVVSALEAFWGDLLEPG